MFIFTEVADFALVGCHIKPDAAAQEMDRLVDVYEDVVDTWGSKVRGRYDLILIDISYI